MKSIFVILALFAASVHAQEVKGISIGMTKDAVDSQLQKLSEPYHNGIRELMKKFPDTTKDYDKYLKKPDVGNIGNSSTKDLVIKYDENNKLIQFSFSFHPRVFDDAVETLKGRYPKIKCENSTTGNAMGATFTQTVCSFGTLTMIKYVGDINTSVISLDDPTVVRQQIEQKKKKLQDDL